MNIRRIWSIRKYLSVDATRILIKVLVISHLDYNKSMLYGIQEGLLHKLQLVQNEPRARVNFKIRKSEHITGVLKTPHWLPVRYRIQYKIDIITYNALSNTGSS